MSDKEILFQAYLKAKENGLDDTILPCDVYRDKCVANDKFRDFYFDCKTYYALIFSQDFAKAFWGEEMWEEDIGGYNIPKWQYNLKRMVLEEEPLKCLEKFLHD